MKPGIGRHTLRAVQVLVAYSIPMFYMVGCRTTNLHVAEPHESKSTTQIEAPRLVSLEKRDTYTFNSLNQGNIAQVSFEHPVGDDSTNARNSETELAQTHELTLSQLIDEVHSVNPTLEAMTAAWQAANQRIPQVSSFDDPIFGSTIAPGSLGSSKVEPAYSFEFSQKLPWYGKRSLRAVAARAEAVTASQDIKTARDKLTEIVQLEFWELYSSERLSELNFQNAAILKSIRANAEIRYRTGLVTERDVLQADVELANLELRTIELSRMNRIAKSNLNALLRRNPTDELTIASNPIHMDEPLQDLESMIQLSVSHRPEVTANAMKIQADRTRLELARKQFYPDTEIFYRHDTFWQPRATQSDLREQVGVRMNLPINHKRLNAAVCEALEQVAKSQAEYDQLLLEIQRDVQAAWERVLESQKTIALYSEKLIPIAENNVSVVSSSYDNSKSTFWELATAQRQMIEFKERNILAKIELKRRIAILKRLVGGTLPHAEQNLRAE